MIHYGVRQYYEGITYIRQYVLVDNLNHYGYSDHSIGEADWVVVCFNCWVREEPAEWIDTRAVSMRMMRARKHMICMEDWFSLSI